ncbi:MAG: 16S rRNA (uracil(1498)-N(3))-methyltransferase [Lentisphaerae bacterium GWF2_45_14]|nr:MAG: 16S rRNA (uracil(1498)-N(3))-methyltransferase [Lentisphaerae bacterium GWF2_45_14]
MNLVILLKDDFKDESHAVIEGRRAKHIIEVHRAEKGKLLKAGLLNSQIGTGLVTEISADSVELEVKLFGNPPPAPPITLIAALPRPKSFRKVLHAAVSMGVKNIYFIASWKVEKSYWESPVIGEKEVFEESILALEQSRDTIMPQIFFRKRFKPFLEDEVPGIIEDAQCLLAHPGSHPVCPCRISRKAFLAIGPEGGFTDYERDLFIERGFSPVSIGERILRTEFAVPALLSRLIF